MPMTEKPTTGGQTTFGSDKEGPHVLFSNGKAGFASGIGLLQPNGTEKILWVNDSGELQIGTRAQFVAMTGATKVGAQ